MFDPRDPVCKVKLLGMVALIFLSGVVTGGFGWELARRTWLRPKPPMLTADDKVPSLVHLSQELELSEQQARALENILDEFIMEQADILARYRTSRASSHDRINQVLNEEQRKRLKKVLEELSRQQQH